MRYSAGNAGELNEGQSRAVKAGDTNVVVYRLSDGFYATQARCTHMFASLAKGKVLDDNCVQCPLHRARFDIRTGDVREWANFPPGVQLFNVVRGEKALQTYAVSEENGELFVEIPE